MVFVQVKVFSRKFKRENKKQNIYARDIMMLQPKKNYNIVNNMILILTNFDNGNKKNDHNLFYLQAVAAAYAIIIRMK